MGRLKDAVKGVPVLGPAASGVWRDLGRRRARVRLQAGSRQYWDDWYARGGTSGPGSYGPLAAFKADVINRFIREHGVASVIELGCGDGNQISLGSYPSYIGLDVSRHVIERCISRFSLDKTKSFFVYDSCGWLDHHHLFEADLALSLDVIFHLVEDRIYETYMDVLFSSARRWVIIYSSDQEGVWRDPTFRHRKFTSWLEVHQPGWCLIEHIPNELPFRGDVKTGSFADFYIYERMAGVPPPSERPLQESVNLPVVGEQVPERGDEGVAGMKGA